MSRNYKNIGNFDVIAINNNDNSLIGTLKAGETSVYDVPVSFCIAKSVSDTYSNFYINYTTSTAFSDSTSVMCTVLDNIYTFDNVEYRRMSQYFGATSTNNYVTIEPKYIENANVDITNNVTGTSAKIANDKLWYIPNFTLTTITSSASFSYDITLTPDSGYSFPVSETQYTLTVTYNDSTTSTVYQTANSTYSSITFTFTYNPTEKHVTSVVITGNIDDKHLIVTFDIPNGTGSVVPENPIRGDVLEMTLSANSGYVISNAYFTYTTELGGLETVYYTISTDKKTATTTFDTSGSDVSPYLKQISNYGITELSEDIPTVSIKFVNANVLTGQNLIELSTKRWYVADSSSPQNVVDLAYYISSLKKFYCNIPTSATGNIYLAWYDTGISTGVVASDFVTIDCGTVTVERPNNNINDYSTTQIQILLPFIGIQSIDSDLIVGKSVHLYYKASTITGDCVAFIDVDGVVLYEYTGSISEDIPYVLNNIAWQLKGSVDFNSSVLYGFTPILTVMYHANYNDNESILLTDEKYAKLSDITGLNYIDDVVIDDSSITDNVKLLIQSELANGVIF